MLKIKKLLILFASNKKNLCADLFIIIINLEIFE